MRDFYGQTETTCQVGNSPGQKVKPGSMGRPAPGYRIRLLDVDDNDADEGEVCIALDPPPLGLMLGYQNEDGSFAPLGREVYRTGDVAARDADGYLTFIGRADDVFKASDYRISPFELESVLIEHAAVAEAAVVPAPDPVRTAVPKAYVSLGGGAATRAVTPRCRSCATCASAWRRTSASAASNFPTCRRPSPAKSAAWNCERRKRRVPDAPPGISRRGFPRTRAPALSQRRSLREA